MQFMVKKRKKFLELDNCTSTELFSSRYRYSIKKNSIQFSSKLCCQSGSRIICFGSGSGNNERADKLKFNF